MAAAAGAAVGSIGSSLLGAYGQEKATDEARKANLQLTGEQIASTEKMFGQNLGFEQQQDTANRAAYEAALSRGQGQMGAGEQSLISEANTPSAMLGQETQDIRAKTAQQLQQGQSQMGANLAAQGVRGGQAATLMNRGAGEMATTAQQGINQMKYEDEASRQADLRAYMAQKARAGQTATLAGVAK